MKKVMYVIGILIPIVVVAYLLNFLGIKEENEWNSTVDKNTSVAYELFISKFPKSEHVTSALKKADEMMWLESLQANTSVSVTSYLEKYPEGIYKKDALIKKEELVWEELQLSHSYRDLENFIAEYPNSKYRQTAQENLEPYLWMEISKDKSYAKYKEYFKMFPEGKHIAQAEIGYEECLWQLVHRKKPLYKTFASAYLKQFPDGKHAAEVRKVISENSSDSRLVKVYTQSGCSRCSYVINYLKDHHIKYKEFNIGINNNNKEMWAKIKKSGKSYGASVTVPVIEFKNKVYFDIADLKLFVNRLKY